MKIFNYKHIITIVFLASSVFASLNLFATRYDQVNDKNTQEQKDHLFIGINGAFSVSQFSNSTLSEHDSWSKVSGYDIIPSIDIYYMLNKNIAFGLGVNVSNYSPGIEVKNFSKEMPTIFNDIDGDNYYPVYDINSVLETTFISTIDFPIYFRYSIDFGETSFFVKTGPVLSIFRNMSYSLEGELSRMGRYPGINVVLGELGDLPEYNYYLNKSFDGNEKMELDAPSIGLSGFLSLGIMYKLNPNFMLSFSVNGNYGLGSFGPNLPPSFNEFYSSQYIGDVSLNSFGVQLGLYYSLSK